MGWFEDAAPAIGGIAGGLIGGPGGAMMGYGLGSGISSAYQNRQAQAQTNAMNIDMMREQNVFQREMSNTAHQREVGDLQAAGLNPILSAGGSGSSTPAGGSASLTAPQLHLPDFVQYGFQLKQLSQADRKLDIDQQNADATAKAVGLKETKTPYEVKKLTSEKELTDAKRVLANKGAPRALLEAEGADFVRGTIRWLKEMARNPKLNKSTWDNATIPLRKP